MKVKEIIEKNEKQSKTKGEKGREVKRGQAEKD